MTLTLTARPAPVPALRIRYLDDQPLGYRIVEACEYPRAYADWELGRVGRIVLPKSMTQAEWDFLMGWLDLTRDGLVVP